MYNAKSARASIRGRANRDEGALLEKMISNSCDYYRERGIADIYKTPEPFKVTRSLQQGQFIGHFASKAQPDYQGVISYGRHIVFDAKATRTDRISVSVLSDKQKEILLRRHKMNALSGVLLCYSFKTFVFMPITTFLEAKKINKHLYWTADEAAAQCKLARFDGKIIYFLGGIT